MKKNRRRKVFPAAACALLAALLLLCALLGEIRLSALRDEMNALEREKAALETERRILTVRLAERLSLDEIERYAVEVLGMQRCRADQCVTLEIEG